MLPTDTFAVYLVAGILAVSAATIVLLLIRTKHTESVSYLKYLAVFILINFLMGALYLWEAFHEVITGNFGYSFVCRVADISLFVAQAYIWVRYLFSSTSEKNTLLKRLSAPGFAVIFIISFITYGFFINSGYEATSSFTAIAEIAIATGISIFQIAGEISVIREKPGRLSVIYTAAVSLILLVNGWWNAVCVLVLLKTDGFIMLTYSTHYCLAGITVLTLIYIYKTDFHSTFLSSSVPDENALINAAVIKYGISEREKDVLILACEGKTNPDIAEELFISINTVKHHLHSIYAKMDVGSRVEMVRKVRG